MTRARPSCPHADIRFCPLYVASHADAAAGCDDGRLGEGGCAVTRGLDYAAAVARLDEREVAILHFRERAVADRAQRDRNLRLAGLH